MAQKVPLKLRGIIGKTEIRQSLRTKTLKEALPLVKVASLAVDKQIGEAEQKLTGKRVAIPELSDEILDWLHAPAKATFGIARTTASAQSLLLPRHSLQLPWD